MIQKSGLKQNHAAATRCAGDVCTPVSSQFNVCLWGDAKLLMGICIVNANQHLQGSPEISLAYSFPSSSLSSLHNSSACFIFAVIENRLGKRM